ncbi:MAG: AI-2E family transporter [Lachnospiraceae bacterium]|nr:AI-2E family transporter [Lachnospiraceae bacterium]
MKFKPDKKYIMIGFIAFLVFACTILFVFAIFNFPVFSKGFSDFIKVLRPAINGFLIAYLLNPVMRFYEEKPMPYVYRFFFKDRKPGVRTKRVNRYISIALAVITVLFCLGLFISIVIPQLIESITSIARQFPQYANNLVAFTNKTFDDNPQVLEYFNQYYERFEEWANSFMKNVPSYINQVWSTVSQGIINSVSFLWNIVLGFILSLYILGFKEKFIAQVRKITLAYCSRERANRIFDDIRDVNYIFKNYIVSSIVDSAIIGVLCFVLCLILQIPYSILISFIVGITNIIPFFGPFIGAVPCAFIVLMIDPIKALTFVIMIIVLQQLDGNVIKPMLFGDSTGLPAFWVIVSILVGGGFFGVMGMYLGTPVFAVIYRHVKRLVAYKLETKGLPSETAKYVRSDELPFEIPESERMQEEKVKAQIIEKIKDKIDTITPDDKKDEEK